MIWFTCSKVEPAPEQTTNSRRTRRNKLTNKPIGLLSYKISTENICEVDEIRAHNEYLPRIPDFRDLAGNSNNPGYPASVINTGAYSDSIGLSGTRNHERADPREEIGTHDLNLHGLDDLYHRNPEEYYDRAAEEWIERLVDNFHNSRSRLYGVSDEEDIDDEPYQESFLNSNDKQEPSLEKEFSTTKGTGSPPNEESGISKPSAEQTILFTRKRKHAASSPSDVEPDRDIDSNIDSNNIQYDANSTTENQSEASATSCGPISKDTDTKDISEATPLGLITPTGHCSPTGTLYFEFEKVVPSAHAQKKLGRI